MLRNIKKIFCKFESKPGLSIIETIMALVVISVSVPLIIGLQSKLLAKTSNISQMIERIAEIKNMFIDATLNNWSKHESAKKFENLPNTKLEYSSNKFLRLNTKGLVKEKIKSEWDNFGLHQEDNFINFQFISETKEE